MIIDIEGLGKVNIVNWDQFKKQLLTQIGAELAHAIRREIDRQHLTGTGTLAQISFKVEGDEIVLTSAAEYAVFLEYGTYSFWKKYGENSFPEPGYPSLPKKKEMTPAQREKAPRGMQPFAPFRRILWNQKVMERVIKRALKTQASAL